MINKKVADALPINRILQLLLLAALFYYSYQVLEFFIKPVIWAMIIAFIAFPLYRKLEARFPKNQALTSLAMTMFIFLIIGIPTTIGIIVLQQKAGGLISQFQQFIHSGNIVLPHFLTTIPSIGIELQTTINQINQNPEILTKGFNTWVQSHLSYGRQIIDGISVNVARFAIIFITIFFLFLDHKELSTQIHKALKLVVGNSIDHYLESIGSTTRAVVESIILTALAQSILASIAYFIIGYFVPDLPNPIMLSAVTLLISVIPFCMPFAWGGVSVWLFMHGHPIAGTALVLWGTFIISWVDNLIRTIIISNATKIPFLLILFGIIGGISLFGFLGLFLGPVILAVTLAVWRNWLGEKV